MSGSTGGAGSNTCGGMSMPAMCRSLVELEATELNSVRNSIIVPRATQVFSEKA